MPKGRLSIGRTSSNVEDDYISIQVEDTDSRITFLTAKVSLEEMMLALTGRAGVEAELRYRGLEYLGKMRETKKEFIEGTQWDIHGGEDLDTIKKLIAPYEVDGWVANVEDFNRRRHYTDVEKGKMGWNVLFERYVDGPRV